jgi:hypothetical protein
MSRIRHHGDAPTDPTNGAGPCGWPLCGMHNSPISGIPLPSCRRRLTVLRKNWNWGGGRHPVAWWLSTVEPAAPFYHPGACPGIHLASCWRVAQSSAEPAAMRGAPPVPALNAGMSVVAGAFTLSSPEPSPRRRPGSARSCCGRGSQTCTDPRRRGDDGRGRGMRVAGRSGCPPSVIRGVPPGSISPLAGAWRPALSRRFRCQRASALVEPAELLCRPGARPRDPRTRSRRAMLRDGSRH